MEKKPLINSPIDYQTKTPEEEEDPIQEENEDLEGSENEEPNEEEGQPETGEDEERQIPGEEPGNAQADKAAQTQAILQGTADQQAEEDLDNQRNQAHMQQLQAQQAAAKAQGDAPTSPIKTKMSVMKDIPLDFLIIAVMAIKDGIDFMFLGFDFNIIGAMFGVFFLVIANSIRKFETSKKQTHFLFTFLFAVILIIECIPLLAAVSLSCVFFFYGFRAEGQYIMAKSKLSKGLSNVVK